VDELTEAEIVRGLRSGESRAWQALCNQYRRRIWAYVARLAGRDQSIVADVFQETLLAVVRSGRNLSSASRLWPWLAAIAHNQVALHWRKQQRRRTEPQD
jgi:RNA polymerase sigma factor (sigma-70 family)